MLRLMMVRGLLVIWLNRLTTGLGRGALDNRVKCRSRVMPAIGTTLGTTGTAILVSRVWLMKCKQALILKKNRATVKLVLWLRPVPSIRMLRLNDGESGRPLGKVVILTSKAFNWETNLINLLVRLSLFGAEAYGVRGLFIGLLCNVRIRRMLVLVHVVIILCSLVVAEFMYARRFTGASAARRVTRVATLIASLCAALLVLQAIDINAGRSGLS